MTRKLVVAAQKLIEDVKTRSGVPIHEPLLKAIEDALPNEHTRHCYIGAPEAYSLDQVAHFVSKALGNTCYLVGSATEKRDFRDVDIRMIFDDVKWVALFGDKSSGGHSFFWSLLCVSVSEYMSKRTGLKVDFQIQKRSSVRKSDWEKPRSPIGMFYSFETDPAWMKDAETKHD